MMKPRFTDVLDAVETLPTDEKERLVEIVTKRLAEERREELNRTIDEAKRDYEDGLGKVGSVDEIMAEILS
jgi:hypothetical protein